MEFPGYGCFSHKIKNGALTSEGLSCSPQKLMSCADTVFQHAITPIHEGGLGFRTDQIIVFGRSIGTGPASYLAEKYKPRAAVLLSPYISIREVAKEKVGWLLSNVVAEHFNIKDMMKNTLCPVLFIHGEDDSMIPPKHSQNLYETLLNQRQNSPSYLESLHQNFQHLDQS